MESYLTKLIINVTKISNRFPYTKSRHNSAYPSLPAQDILVPPRPSPSYGKHPYYFAHPFAPHERQNPHKISGQAIRQYSELIGIYSLAPANVAIPRVVRIDESCFVQITFRICAKVFVKLFIALKNQRTAAFYTKLRFSPV